ncbi:uncharacterized protein [Argopecten irradians]|uniref:uncharacterized protein n=1 Tax=Argopecten irradians TaxID=31199 RepID=UPI003720265B
MWNENIPLVYHSLTGILFISLTLWVTDTTGGTSSAFIRMQRGSNLSLYDMFDLQDVQCGNAASGSFRDGKTDTFREKDCTNKKLHIRFLLNGIPERTITLVDDPPKIQLDAFLRLQIHTMTPALDPIADLDQLHFVLNAGNYELILTRDNDTSSAYAAIYNSPDEEERPRFFFVKKAPAASFTLGHNQSLLGEMECWVQAFDEYDTLELEMEYDHSCKETNATYRYGTCTEAVAEELCDCDCAYFEKMRTWETLLAFDNRTEEAKSEEVKAESVETKAKLTVNKTQLSSGKRKKISAPDTRESATNIGILGTVMMGLVIGSLLVCDLLSIKRHIRSARRNR